MTQSCPNNGRFPTVPEALFALLVMTYIAKTLNANQAEALIAMGAIAELVLMYVDLRDRT